jgi:hypothetical protein
MDPQDIRAWIAKKLIEDHDKSDIPTKINFLCPVKAGGGLEPKPLEPKPLFLAISFFSPV